jgi:MFS family permease
VTTTSSQALTRATYGEVLAVTEFRALFLSRSLAIAAITLRILAVSVLVLAATGSPLMAGIAFGAGFLPQLVGGMTLMALADRLRPRRALALGGLLEAAAALAIALVALPAWGVLVLVASVATVTPVFSAAASGLVPTLLTGDRYVLGRSLLTVSSSAAQVAGLGIGGLVLAVLAPRQVLLVVAGLQLMAVLMTRLLLADRPPRATDRAMGTLRATWRGNRALLRDRAIRGQILVQVLPPSLLTGAEGLVVAYVAQVGAPPSRAGWLLAVAPVGMGLGNLAVGRLFGPATRERLVLPLVALIGVPLLALALAPPLPVAGVLIGLATAGLAYELGVQQRFLGAVPEQLRGQAFGLLGTLLMFGQGVGPVVAGAAGSAATPAAAMATVGVAVMVTALALRHHLRPG